MDSTSSSLAADATGCPSPHHELCCGPHRATLTAAGIAIGIIEIGNRITVSRPTETDVGCPVSEWHFIGAAAIMMAMGIYETRSQRCRGTMTPPAVLQHANFSDECPNRNAAVGRLAAAIDDPAFVMRVSCRRVRNLDRHSQSGQQAYSQQPFRLRKT